MAPISAWEITNSLAAVTIVSASSALAVLATLVALSSIGRLDPNSRRFKTWVLIVAAIAVTIGGVWTYTKYSEFRLPRASIRFVTNNGCIKASYLATDASGVTLVDGLNHSLRMVAAKDIAEIAVTKGAFRVLDTLVGKTACPTDLKLSQK